MLRYRRVCGRWLTLALLFGCVAMASCSKGAAVDKDAGTEVQAPGPGTVTSAAGRTRGNTYKVEFQLGHPVSHRPTSGETTATSGASAVEP